MTERTRPWRRLLLLAVLLVSLFAAADTGASTSNCPYAPGHFGGCGDEPNNCELRCCDQFDACMSATGNYSTCDAQRACCMYRCGA